MAIGQLNSGPADIRNQSQFFSTQAGGRRAFNATAGAVQIGANGGVALICTNPSGSGIDVYIDKIVLSADTVGRYERFRNGTISIGNGAIAVPSVSRGGGSAVSACKIYGPTSNLFGGGTVNNGASGGIVGVVSFIGASVTEPDAINGSIILRPGNNLYWTFVPKVSGSSTSLNAIEVVWWEKLAES